MLTVLTFASVVLASAYFFLLLWYYILWNRIDDVQIDEDFSPLISVIIVARNEAERVGSCLRSIIQNDYPIDKYEIILVDDHSDDDTLSIALSLGIQNLQVIRLSDQEVFNDHIRSYKKMAQKRAADSARGEFLLFTDADVIVPKLWIRQMTTYVKNGNLMMATGTVRYDIHANDLLAVFQALDVAGTMIMTQAGIQSKMWHLANGANMIVDKNVYLNTQNDLRHDLASGDDVFLIQAIAGINASTVGFVKSMDACVTTYPEKSVEALMEQRIRWGTKTGAYNNFILKSKISLVYFFQLILLTILLYGVFGNGTFLEIFFLCLMLKVGIDVLVLNRARKDFQLPIPLFYLPIVSVLHWFYLIILGTLSLTRKKYNWKGRRVI